MILKLDCKKSVISNGVTPTRIVFKRSWSFPAIFEAFGVLILMLSATALALLTFNSGTPITSPELRTTVIIGGGIVSVVLSGLVYSLSREQYFLTSVSKRYGYVLEDFDNSIVDESSDKKESRMLLPMSSIMPSNSDIYIVRTKRGAFVEEVRS